MNSKGIKEMREQKGLSRRELSLAIGFTEQTIYLIETYEDKVTTSEVVARLADYFGVSTDYILGRKEATK